MFKEREVFDPRLEGKNKGSDSEGCFAVSGDALSFQRAAQEIGVNCETVYGSECGSLQADDVVSYQLLGFDVCQKDTGSDSAIVNLCLSISRESQRPQSMTGYETVQCVGHYFNSLLNASRLFDDQADAELCLRVYGEIHEKFWNSTEKDLMLRVFGVYAVG